MRYLSVCSGIEAATVAWHPLGWEPAAFAEIESFPAAVLKHHYPTVTNLGDMTKYKEWNIGPIDLLVGGTPCQSFSVAGLRKGLDDPRGNLALVYLGIAERFRPRWILWENVPGVLSSNGGRDFGAFLGALAQLGYGFAYRILDAQYFGVAQRRRRVFVVGYLGDWRRSAAVLFERESLSGNPAPSRKAGQGVTPTIRSGAPNGSRSHGQRSGDTRDELIVPVVGTLATNSGPNGHDAGNFQCNQAVDAGHIFPVVGPLSANGGTDKKHGFGMGQQDWENGYAIPVTCMAHGQANAEIVSDGEASLTCNHEAPIVAFNHQIGGDFRPQVSENCANVLQRSQGKAICFEPGIAAREGGDNRFSVEVCPTLRKEPGDNHPAVAFAQNTRDEVREMPYVGALAAEPGMKQSSYIRQQMQVRRLTPEECEKLQGFSPSYTNIPWRNKSEAPDGPRYKALGNSMAVPVMRWIGRRIQEVDAI